jgi:hypothetical protein
MTVISTIFTRHFTVLASDSRISYEDRPRAEWPDDSSKLIRADRWRGAMAYWGLAFGPGWNTRDFLEEMTTTAPVAQRAEDFAKAVAQRLTDEFLRRTFTDDGLGIHFTAYEEFDNDWIPELFVITNWRETFDPPYRDLLPQGFEVTRETYQYLRRVETGDNFLKVSIKEQRKSENRKAFFKALHEDLMPFFHNGDPVLFNPIAASILMTFRRLYERGQPSSLPCDSC